MIKTSDGGITVLQAENGFMLSNGEVYGKTVYLAEDDTGDSWYETEEVCDEY